MNPINIMCGKCAAPTIEKPSKQYLWTLASNMRCALIGTCLEINELKRVANRFLRSNKEVVLQTDYDFHSYFVSTCGSKNPVSVYLNKLLNRQYQAFIRQSQKLKSDEEIYQVWCAVDRNDLRSLSGFFWSFVTSRHASQGLKDYLYGDIHMISHIAGRSEKSARHKLLLENQRLLAELSKKEQQFERKSRQLQDQYLQIEKLENQNSSLNRLMQQLKFHSDFSRPKREKYESRIYEQQLQIERLQRQLQRAQRQQQQTGMVKVEVANGLTESIAAAEACCELDCEHCDHTDLCGKTILYVGGFSRHRKKFQHLTEQINGRFFYHDGGMQQSEHQLDELVKKADCVFCPVDCISHNAMGRIKNLVKAECKDCVFLKSASISSFRNEVLRYAS